MKTLEDFEVLKTPKKEEKTPTPEGLVLHSVCMKNFMRYVDKTRISFPEKFTVITGGTGSGKTTILDAITFALYRKNSRTDVGVRVKDLCRENGCVEINFSQGGKTYQVRRGVTSVGKSYATLKIDGKKFAGNIREIDRKICEIIGLDYLGFRNSTFVRQEEMKALGSERGSERLKILQKLFRLEIFGKAQGVLKERLRKEELELKSLEAEVAAKKEFLTPIPEKEKELKDKEALMRQEEIKLEGLKKAIGEKKKEFKEMRDKHEEYLTTKENLENAEKGIDEVMRKLKKVKSERDRVDKLKTEIAELTEETKDIEQISKSVEERKEKRYRFNSLQEKKSLYKMQKKHNKNEWMREKARISQKLRGEEARIRSLKTTIDCNKAFKLLRREGALNERVTRIEKEIEWLAERAELIRKLKEEQSAAAQELENVSQEVVGINKDSFVLSEIKKHIEVIKKDLEVKKGEYVAKNRELEKPLHDITAGISALGFDPESQEKLENLLKEKQRKMRELENKKNELYKVGDLSKLLADLSEQKAKNEERVENCRSKLERLKQFEQRYYEVEEELETVGEQHTALTNEIAGLAKEIKMLENELAKLNKIKKEIEGLKEKARKVRERMRIYSILKDGVFHKKGIVMYSINQLLPHLGIETSKNLSALTDGRFAQVKLTPYEEMKEYGVRIDVLGVDGAWHDVQEFSGGERTQINAALRFAIAKELAALLQVGKTYGKMKTLFIDEGDLGSLDTEISRELFVKRLFDMGDIFEKIILITHLTEVAEKFPHRIQVVMAEGRSQVI